MFNFNRAREDRRQEVALSMRSASSNYPRGFPFSPRWTARGICREGEHSFGVGSPLSQGAAWGVSQVGAASTTAGFSTDSFPARIRRCLPTSQHDSSSSSIAPQSATSSFPLEQTGVALRIHRFGIIGFRPLLTKPTSTKILFASPSPFCRCAGSSKGSASNRKAWFGNEPRRTRDPSWSRRVRFSAPRSRARRTSKFEAGAAGH